MTSFESLLLWLCMRKRAIMKATKDRVEILRVQQGLGGVGGATNG